MVFLSDVNPLTKSRSKLLLEKESMDLLQKQEIIADAGNNDERSFSLAESMLAMDEEAKEILEFNPNYK